MSRNIPDKEMKALIALSGGVCAFPDCNKRLLEPGNTDDDAAFLGEMAHIVADSRQGPRGVSPLSDEDRDKHTNLLLLCGDHHKVIDSQPRTYSVPVLRRIKEDHEGRIRRATSGPAPAPSITLSREVIHSSLFAVTHLPAVVFAAPCAFHEGQDDQVKERLHFPDGDSQLVRFILRDGKLFSFHNLKDPRGPFRDVINQKGVETIRSEQWWDDPEGHRRYVTLLNRGLYKYAARKRVRFDPAHKRLFFDAITPGQPRQEQYRPLNAKTRKRRNVVWQPKIKATGEPRNYWWHLAAGLAFFRADKRQWCFCIRPERHLTSDGMTPLPPKQIGRRVTSKKARMWNDIYLGEVNFWRDYLSGGNQKIVLNFGDQSAVIDTEMLTFGVNWPGIPGDSKPFTNTTYDMDCSPAPSSTTPWRGTASIGRTTMTAPKTKRSDNYKIAPVELDQPRLTGGWVDEPALLFADGHEHVDPKTGIPLYGPRSLGTHRHKREVHVGFIGTSGSVDLSRRYYEQASLGVDGDDDHAPFPGCRADRGFRCDLVYDNKLVELLTRSEHQDILGIKRSRERFEELLRLLESKLRLLTQKDHPLDYVVLALPTDLYQRCRAVDYVEKGFGHVHRDLRREQRSVPERGLRRTAG